MNASSLTVQCRLPESMIRHSSEAVFADLVAARAAVEALRSLPYQRAGLRDTCFIAMSNYYHDEKSAYLSALSQVRSGDGDLTPFLRFGLRGIAIQSRRMADRDHRIRVLRAVERPAQGEDAPGPAIG